jgi:signal transduction histidine kinase
LTLAGIFLAGLVTAFYSYRLARLREVNSALEEARSAEERLRHSREERLAELEQVRSRIATDLHDDIGASLTQIAILSEVAQAQSKNGSSEPLKQITSVSNELVGTMSDIVWSINPQKDHFSDLTQRMRRFASDVLSAKRIGLQFEASHETDAVILNSNIRREVFLVFKEAINNIVKHSEAGRVEVTVGIDDGEMRLMIRDDGRGFASGATDDTDGGNGVPSMKRRAHAIDGRLEIETAAGDGTVIRLNVPIDRTTRTGGEKEAISL